MSDTTKVDENEDLDEVPESEKTPVTIVTGFLGAGKTTLGKFDFWMGIAHKLANGIDARFTGDYNASLTSWF